MISIEETIIYSGILLKRARFTLHRRWQKRLFKLTSKELHYYRDHTSSQPSYSINRSTIISAHSNEQAKSIYEFCIILTTRTIRCKAPTIEAKKDWIYYLQPCSRYFKRYPTSYINNSVRLNQFVYNLRGPVPLIKTLERHRYRDLSCAFRRFYKAVIHKKSSINLIIHIQTFTQFIQFEQQNKISIAQDVQEENARQSESIESELEVRKLKFPYLGQLFLRLNCLHEKSITRQAWKCMILRELR
jgi:hypothetical protein